MFRAIQIRFLFGVLGFGSYCSRRLIVAPLVLISVSAGNITAQNLLPNPHFAEGDEAPRGWRLADGPGTWSGPAVTGATVRVEGRGEDQSIWRTEGVEMIPGGLYRLTFQACRVGAARGGTAVSGTGRVNRDFPLTPDWQNYGFAFAVPTNGARDYVRLGQWHVAGGMEFRRAGLHPVMAVHETFSDGFELGEAESVRGGVYRFRPDFGWAGANYHRPLVINRAGFNSDRWLFGPGAEVVYRLAAGGWLQTGAMVSVAINHHTAGGLRVEASGDGVAWQTVTNYDGGRRGGQAELPSTLFPARDIFIRLRSEDSKASFQVNTFDYEAALDRAPSDVEGMTRFLSVEKASPGLMVHWQSLRLSGSPDQWTMSFAVTNLAGAPLTVRARAWLDADAPPDDVSSSFDWIETSGLLTAVAPVGAVGLHQLQVQIGDESGQVLFKGGTDVRVGFLRDPLPGYWLTDTNGLGLWWCESGWKIGRERGIPARPSDGRPRPVHLSAARGEDEPVQVILRPDRGAKLLSARVESMRDTEGKPSPVAVRIDEVAYVQVTRPTDAVCLRGWYPDPLPPLGGLLELRSGINQPLWLTARVPRTAAAGEHRGYLVLATTLGTVRVPLTVQVYGFTLPEQTHLRSALGLGAREINRYHHLTSPEDKQAVFEKYLKNFAEHRISPYSFFDYSPIGIRFDGEGSNKTARLDFSKFDAAAEKWIDGHRFNTFRLPLHGLGGGTFHSRYLGRLEGFEEGTPEHARMFQDYLRQVERHLRERGWLDEAFTYWFDEPDPKDYEFVVAGQQRIRTAAPGIRRMLTEQPEPALLGHVDIWCGLTPEWTPETVRARREAGEEVWWYICTAPKAPYLTEFIDHPGTELRLWPWQSWQYGVNGILVWATLYWNSPAAFPPPDRQDPWEDPMSYVSGYDYRAGHVGYWGNGDGRFLYPPRRPDDPYGGPILDDPINSIRWENLRDGMEDYEYFWLLQEAVNRHSADPANAALLTEARALLTVPPTISKDLTHFTIDPRLMLDHRERVARMIERLSR